MFLTKNTAIILVLGIFYLVGIVGLSIESTRAYLLPYSFFNLALSFALLLYSYRFDAKIIFISALIYLIGFSVELIGVHTGLLFGNYTYGSNLGFKIAEVPVIIGANWVILCLCSSQLINFLKLPVYFSSFLVALIMTGLDFIIEPVAIKLNYWTWEGEIPNYNYISWFVISYIVSFIAYFYTKRFKNIPALFLLFYISLFFIILNFM